MAPSRLLVHAVMLLVKWFASFCLYKGKGHSSFSRKKSAPHWLEGQVKNQGGSNYFAPFVKKNTNWRRIVTSL